MLPFKKLYFVLGILGVALLITIYFKFDPAKYSFFPQCPFHKLTGFDCPGCGSQRAIASLLHGEFFRAVGYNILLVISLPFLLIHALFTVTSYLKKTTYRWGLIYHPLTPKIILVVVVAFWIARNIPVSPFNYLSAGHQL